MASIVCLLIIPFLLMLVGIVLRADWSFIDFVWELHDFICRWKQRSLFLAAGPMLLVVSVLWKARELSYSCLVGETAHVLIEPGSEQS